ncbi:Ig-like domain-containing protein [Paenibacillus sp. CF384]|uniref:Ig-like domain-containing protein n=1 Tax=Paenibacillus sp. CF384 TaxID=1884382 RepID=UPI00089D59AC|nr:Ig-like domain-containing protein [Paenibacillus sp. CF384]SDX28024.1 repeat-containing protein [Paenibacillus sp. CF384]
MVRNRRWVSILTVLMVVQCFIIGGFVNKPAHVSAAASGPVISSFSPSVQSANVPVNTNLILAFDENVKKGTGSATIQIRRQLDNQLFESYTVASDSKVAVGSGTSRNIVTISPSTNFALNTSYYVTIDAGAFANDANANFAGLTSAVGWVFTTVSAIDTTAPTLSTSSSSLTPANGATAGVGTSLMMAFSEPVYAASGNITVTNVNQPADTQSISVNSINVTGSGSAGKLIVVSLPSSLQGNSTYEVVVPSGAFQDAAGNNFNGITTSSWRFTTNAPPIGNAVLSPADNAFAVSVASNFTLTFPGRVRANTGTISINKISDNSTVQEINVASSAVSVVSSGAGSTVIINPPADLAANTGFYILIDSGAFVDASDASKQYQGMQDATSWNFYTDPGNDTTPPSLLAERKPLNAQSSTSINLEMNFSEPVYPGTGTITVRTYPSGAVFASIPVTSSKVSGGGSTKIIVTDTSKTYVNNQSYYVEIGGQAFSDAKGNYYSGLSGSSAWRFTVTQDSVSPTIVTQTPANTAIDVPVLGMKLEALFSEPILLGADSSAIVIRPITSGSGGSAIATTYAIDPNNNRNLLITLNGAMLPNTDYYVEMAAGAVMDLAGNPFDGILNQYQWTFKTSSGAAGAPTVTRADLVGSTKIAITYNENLSTSSDSIPVPANFYVTVNGAGRTVTAVQISGQVVTLTLQSAASYGQVIRVSYSAGSKPIKDLTGTAAANFSNLAVSNVPDSTAPRQVSGTIAGNLIILTMSEELAALNQNAYLQFTVLIDGAYRTVTQISGSGNTVFLNFSGNSASIGQSVTLSYSAGSYPLRDLSNNALGSFSGFYIQNGQDAKAPLLQSITSSGYTITLNYDEGLNGALIPYTSSFYVTVNGTLRTVSYVTVNGTQVILSLSTSTIASDVILVTYLGGVPAITDLGGIPAQAFSAMQANAGGTTTLGLNGIVAKGGEVTITFSSPLNTSYLPSTSQFSVKVNNVSRPVSSAAIKGSAVVLSLYTPISVGDTVKASYSSAGTSIRSTTGAIAAAFTDSNVANQTTWDDSTSGDFKSAVGGGLEIKVASATTASAVSPAGNAVNKFILSSEKVAQAYNAVRKAGGTLPRVVFTVPDSEKAAVVALPLGTLEDTKKATSNASFAIVYKNVTYEFPLSALNYVQLGQMMNAASAVGQLNVSIDTNAGSLGSTLTSQLNGSNAQILINPISFEMSVSSNGQTKNVETLNNYVTRSITSSAVLDGKAVSVAWLDPQTNKLSYVPTRVTRANGQSVISFKRKGNSVYAVVQGAAGYTDLTNHWARGDILLLAKKYIVEGNTLTTFAPKKAITRGEFAMFIAKGLGLAGDRTAAGKFKDVNTSTALAAYIGAASAAGIVKGMADGSFKPNNPITREEMASMMVRAASAAGVSIVPKQTTTNLLKKYTDRGKIGTWAQTDVAKAVDSNIISGLTTSTFGAKNKATRAEAAVMLKRLLSYLEFIDI